MHARYPLPPPSGRFSPPPRRARLAALGLAAALSVSGLTGCGSASGAGSADVTMWTFKQSHVAGLRAAAAEFGEKTGIEVRIEAYTPDDAYSIKVQSSAMTGDLPDVFEVHSDGEDFVYGAAGIVEDLRGQVPASWNNRSNPAVRHSGTVTQEKYEQSLPVTSTSHGAKKGARYSLPFTIGTFGIVYANKAKLAAAGITRPPATWEEFIADLKKTKAKDPRTGGLSLGLKVPSTGLNWIGQPLAFAQLGKDGYEALYGREKSADWGSPNGVKVLDAYDRLTPYWMPGTQTLTIDDADQAFAQGKSAFDVGGTFTLAFLQEAGMKADDILAFGVPAPQEGAVKDLALGPIALTGLALSDSSPRKDEARKWMRYLSEPDVAARFSKAASDLSATELGAESADVLGPNLARLMATFKGTPENTYNPYDTSFRPPTLDMDEAGAPLIDMSPLRLTSPAQTGLRLRTLIDSYWKEAS
ncbi:extracellular solute-binding protein [Streptomyces sp. NPDC094472]|uniref:ABC transporter substrate-binding protein n=1 Tax=Streptomyces sp. NPDC094472 TaxID=3155080 RepID=UPI0033346DE1